MTAKCNITGLVLEEIGSIFYGFKCKDNSYAIIENYIESLKCANVNLEICYPANCTNEPIIFNCNFNIVRINMTESDSDNVTFIFTTSVVGGTTPFTYQWSFETDDFNIAGAANQATLVLTIKPGKSIADLVSQVSVTITDANGCTDTKSCWISSQEMLCSVNFVPCVNPSNLTINNPVLYCVAPSNLIVT